MLAVTNHVGYSANMVFAHFRKI